MNIESGRIYPSLDEARAAGEPEDKLVSGTKKAIDSLHAKMFPKRRRAKLRKPAR